MAIRVPSRTKQRRYGHVRVDPVCPILIGPSGELASNEDVVFEWGATLQATHYQIMVRADDEEEFSELAVTTETTYTASEFSFNESFNWYVNPGFLRNGEFVALLNCEDPLVFVTPGPPVDCVTLLTPAAGATFEVDESLDIEFSWTAVDDAVTYRFFIWEEGDIEPIIASAETSATSLVRPIGAPTNSLWKIVPANSFGSGPSCETRAFSTTVAVEIPCAGPVQTYGDDGLTIRKNDGNGFTGNADITLPNTNVINWLQDEVCDGYIIEQWTSATEEEGCRPQTRYLSVNSTGRGSSPSTGSIARVQFPAITAEAGFAGMLFIGHSVVEGINPPSPGGDPYLPRTFDLKIEIDGVELIGADMIYPGGFEETIQFEDSTHYWRLFKFWYIFNAGDSIPSQYGLDEVTILDVKNQLEP